MLRSRNFERGGGQQKFSSKGGGGGGGADSLDNPLDLSLFLESPLYRAVILLSEGPIIMRSSGKSGQLYTA